MEEKMIKIKQVFPRSYDNYDNENGIKNWHGEILLKGNYLEKFGFKPGNLVSVFLDNEIIGCITFVWFVLLVLTICLIFILGYYIKIILAELTVVLLFISFFYIFDRMMGDN